MKKSFLFLCVCLLVLAGCKKESTDLNKAAISIIVLPIEENGVTGSEFNYKLKAMMVSPAKVEVEDHGFLVSGIGPTDVLVPLGSGDVAGGIEADFVSPLPEGQFTVAAYAKLKNGEMLYSTGYTPAPPPAATINIAYSNYNSAYHGSLLATFEGQIVSSVPGRYLITEVGVDYANNSYYTANSSYNMNRHTLPNSTDQVYTIFLQYPINGVDFSAKDSYHFMLYAKVTDLQTSVSTTIFSGSDQTFATP